MAAVGLSPPVLRKTWQRVGSHQPAVLLGSLSPREGASEVTSPSHAAPAFSSPRSPAASLPRLRPRWHRTPATAPPRIDPPANISIFIPVASPPSPRQLYTDAVHRIGRASELGGVLLPHAVFACLAASLFHAFPSLVVYLATETMLTALLSTWLPLACSVLLVHDLRAASAAAATAVSDTATAARSDEKTEKAATPASGDKKKRPRRVFARTHPSPRETPTTTARTPVLSPLRLLKQPPHDPLTKEATLEERTNFWVDYWIVHAAVRFVVLVTRALPLLGRVLAGLSRTCASAVALLELGVYVWFFTMPHLFVEPSPSQEKDGRRRLEGRPLPLLRRALEPLLGRVVDSMGSIITQETWGTYVLTPAAPVLQLLVTVRLLGPGTRDVALLALRQARGLVIPCVWLGMPVPGAARLAVLYVQWLLPLAKSSSCRLVMPSVSQNTEKSPAPAGQENKTKMRKGAASPPKGKAAADQSKKSTAQALADPKNAGDGWSDLLLLQYWILNTLASLLVDPFVSMFWWLPFINVALFAGWWYLSIDATIVWAYQIWERDLKLIGILDRHEGDIADGDEGELNTTPVLYGAICWILNRLPSGVDRELFTDDEEDEDVSQDASAVNHAENIDEVQNSVDSDELSDDVDNRVSNEASSDDESDLEVFHGPYNEADLD